MNELQEQLLAELDAESTDFSDLVKLGLEDRVIYWIADLLDIGDLDNDCFRAIVKDCVLTQPANLREFIEVINNIDKMR